MSDLRGRLHRAERRRPEKLDAAARERERVRALSDKDLDAELAEVEELIAEHVARHGDTDDEDLDAEIEELEQALKEHETDG